eukprot:Lankesteria_metandrocarpae@DN9407_c0_g1_i1.p1
MMKAIMMADEAVTLTRPQDIRVGDWVVYWLSNYERAKNVETIEGRRFLKYTPQWSAPVRVVEVKDQAVVLELLDEHHKYRQTPLRLVRKVTGEIPKSLQPLMVRQLQQLSADYALLPLWAPAAVRRAVPEMSEDLSEERQSGLSLTVKSSSDSRHKKESGGELIDF